MILLWEGIHAFLRGLIIFLKYFLIVSDIRVWVSHGQAPPTFGPGYSYFLQNSPSELLLPCLSVLLVKPVTQLTHFSGRYSVCIGSSKIHEWSQILFYHHNKYLCILSSWKLCEVPLHELHLCSLSQSSCIFNVLHSYHHQLNISKLV